MLAIHLRAVKLRQPSCSRRAAAIRWAMTSSSCALNASHSRRSWRSARAAHLARNVRHQRPNLSEASSFNKPKAYAQYASWRARRANFWRTAHCSLVVAQSRSALRASRRRTAHWMRTAARRSEHSCRTCSRSTSHSRSSCMPSRALPCARNARHRRCSRCAASTSGSSGGPGSLGPLSLDDSGLSLDDFRFPFFLKSPAFFKGLPAFSLAGRPLRGDERSRAEDDGVPVEDMGDFFKPFLVLSGTRGGGALAA